MASARGALPASLLAALDEQLRVAADASGGVWSWLREAAHAPASRALAASELLHRWRPARPEPLIGDIDRTALIGSPAVIRTPFGPAKPADAIRLACLDAIALGLPDRVSPSALAEAARLCATALGQRFPGQVIEVRIPPAAAVQLGAFGQGPRHTRGTPPNVVETDPRTFVELALGSLTWEAAAPLLSLSGVHAGELARMLPLVGH